MSKRPTGRCPLCEETKLLCDSHYLPQKLYAFGRAEALSNPNPVMPVRGESKQISDQYRGYVFCEDCENLFNENGEKWVLANIPHDYDDPMPLEKALAGLAPVATGKDVVLLDASGVPACDMAKLVYFGISIFWRGSAYDWKSTRGERPPKVELCAYAEPLRQFLLGTAVLPDDVVLTVDMWSYKRALQISYPPIPSHLPECQRYWFHVPGLVFSLFVGSRIPLDTRIKNAAKGRVGTDRVLSDSILDYSKKGIKSLMHGPKIEKMLQEIETIRSKTSFKE